MILLLVVTGSQAAPMESGFTVVYCLLSVANCLGLPVVSMSRGVAKGR
jgi:hypothetical protein